MLEWRVRDMSNYKTIIDGHNSVSKKDVSSYNRSIAGHKSVTQQLET